MRLIDRFGWQAVQVEPAAKLRGMIAAEQIVNLFRSRDAAKEGEGGWAKWEQDHPQSSAALKFAMALAMDMEADDDGES